MAMRTFRGFVREATGFQTTDAAGKVTWRPLRSRDTIMEALNFGRPHDPGLRWVGEMVSKLELLAQLAESKRKELAATPALNSPIDVDKILEPEGPGGKRDDGRVWPGFERIVNGMLKEIQSTPISVDALEAEPAFAEAHKDAATLRRMNDSNRRFWDKDTAQRVTDTRAAVGDAGRAVDMRSKIAALNRAAAAFWRGNESAE